MAISNIERRSTWYDIYDERGKKQKHYLQALEKLKDLVRIFL